MGTHLVIANQTAISDELVSELRSVASEAKGAAFYLLVPATPVEDLLTVEDGQAREIAARRAGKALTYLTDAGIHIVGASVGSASPAEAIGAQLRQVAAGYESIIVSTFDPGTSRWLETNLLEGLGGFGLPVRHVIARPPRASRFQEAEPPASRYLVVAHQTAESFELEEVLRDVAVSDAAAAFSLLVPITPAGFLLARSEEADRQAVIAEARSVGALAAASLRAAGLRVSEVLIGDEIPLVALEEEMGKRPQGYYSEIILSTLPADLSRWLRLDQVRQAQQRFGVPVRHVVGLPKDMPNLEEIN